MDCKGGVQEVDGCIYEPKIEQKLIEKPPFFQDEKPGVDMEEEVGPEGDDHQKQKKCFKTSTFKSDCIGEWESEQKGDQGGGEP